MQKITPFLWFNNDAEEAVEFYRSIFKNSKTNRVARYGSAGPGPAGSVMTIEFELEGLLFTALNGGPEFKFNESVSFVVNCETQAEVDEYWEKLSAGGATNVCGWLKDKYGLSWQITPTILLKYINDPDPVRSQRVMKAMMEMTKIDIAKIQQAYDAK